jgi:phosphatidylserine synthase
MKFLFKSDQYIINILIKPHLFLFKNIHPNYISFIGIFLNYLILNFYYKDYNKLIITLITMVRIYCDSLDGLVARKFNKTSDIGGLLDTIDDMILIIIMSYIFFFKYIQSYAYYLSILIGMICTYYLYSNNSLCLHSNFFNKKKPLNYDKFFIFLGNNTFLCALIWIIMIE